MSVEGYTIAGLPTENTAPTGNEFLAIDGGGGAEKLLLSKVVELAATDGVAGASAYETAVANGFVGDEAAWLASLAGSDGADGAEGPPGADGAVGPAGPGLPTGGTIGQVPVKASATDYDLAWGTSYAAGGVDVAIADGGTGASTVDGARANLEAVGSADASVTQIIALTQAEYDALTPPDPTTFYVVTT